MACLAGSRTRKDHMSISAQNAPVRPRYPTTSRKFVKNPRGKKQEAQGIAEMQSRSVWGDLHKNFCVFSPPGAKVCRQHKEICQKRVSSADLEILGNASLCLRE